MSDSQRQLLCTAAKTRTLTILQAILPILGKYCTVPRYPFKYSRRHHLLRPPSFQNSLPTYPLGSLGSMIKVPNQ